MAKDFDFLPAKGAPKQRKTIDPSAIPRRGAAMPPKLIIRPKAKAPGLSAANAVQKKAAKPVQKRTAKPHLSPSQTRSSLINYHPLSNATVSQRPEEQIPSPEPATSVPRTPRRPSAMTSKAYLLNGLTNRNLSVKNTEIGNRQRISALSRMIVRILRNPIFCGVFVFIALSILLGLPIPLLDNPSILVLLYAAVAFIFRLRSTVSFIAAFLCLMAVLLIGLFRPEGPAATYGILCFYLVVIGGIKAGIELHKSAK
jgi:hypothetical protein